LGTVLRRIFGPKRNKVTGWIKLLPNLYVLLAKYWNDQIKEDEMGRVCIACNGGK
jgi:hypothetical protein